MKCPDCGVEIDVPEDPGPCSPCDCNPGWYRVGAMVDPDTGTSEIRS